MIRSRQNQTIKTIRGLRRRQGEHALLEGPHLLREALASGLPLEAVLATPGFLARAEGHELVRRLSTPPTEVAEEVFDSLCESDTPRGVLAVVRLERGAIERLPRLGTGLYLFLDAVQDPGNLGAIARAAEAFGVAGLALAPGCAHPNHPRALRASAGSLLRLPVAREASAGRLDAHLDTPRPTWLGLVAHGGEPAPRLSPATACVLALGAEGGGLSATTEARLDGRWSLPLRPPVESLNVAVAAGIALYALDRERGATV